MYEKIKLYFVVKKTGKIHSLNFSLANYIGIGSKLKLHNAALLKI